ncbi:MAG TPA: metal-binding protein [Oxalobacteraceae bacterium]|nr:metal-binding protein [Oxalobacteraceae bacterium]
MKHRIFSKLILAGSLALPLLASAAAPVVEVFKSPHCGCCTGWVEHMQANGFDVKVKNVESPSDYREKFGMPEEFGSCHTAKVEGYAIEGHVPAADVKRLLAEKPKAIGLAAPGMPMGSPGMEGPRKDAYDVYLVQPKGKKSVYKHYTGK